MPGCIRIISCFPAGCQKSLASMLRCRMPIYTYRCENCGVQFDRQQKFSDPLLTRCPECNKKALRKVYQPVGIVFKGSGFYATDHRSPSGSHSASNHKGEGECKSSERSPARSGGEKSEKSQNSESNSKAEKKSNTRGLTRREHFLSGRIPVFHSQPKAPAMRAFLVRKIDRLPSHQFR